MFSRLTSSAMLDIVTFFSFSPFFRLLLLLLKAEVDDSRLSFSLFLFSCCIYVFTFPFHDSHSLICCSFHVAFAKTWKPKKKSVLKPTTGYAWWILIRHWRRRRRSLMFCSGVGVLSISSILYPMKFFVFIFIFALSFISMQL